MRLSSDSLVVHVEPDRGADIVQITDLCTGLPLLAVSPTLSAGRSRVPGDSMSTWLNGYPGGWQLLVPNAGPARVHDGVEQGYHGEAALASWRVIRAADDSAVFETRLFTSPLHLRRTVAVESTTLTVIDEVTNESPDEVSLRMVQHPAFGSPFLDEHSTVAFDARTVIADASAPGTLAAPGIVGPPAEVVPAIAVPGGVRVPGTASGSALFAALTDFPDDHAEATTTPGQATFISPTAGFAVTLSWDTTVLPHAWFWIEARATPGWPWFRRMYAVAIEPANVLPGEGRSGRFQRGGAGTLLAPGATMTSHVSLTRHALPSAVDPAGPPPADHDKPASEHP